MLCWKCECFVIAVVKAGRAFKRRPYGGGILQSRLHDCLVGSHESFI